MSQMTLWMTEAFHNHQVQQYRGPDGVDKEYRLADADGDQVGDSFVNKISAIKTAQARSAMLDMVNDDILRQSDAANALSIVNALSERLTATSPEAVVPEATVAPPAEDAALVTPSAPSEPAPPLAPPVVEVAPVAVEVPPQVAEVPPPVEAVVPVEVPVAPVEVPVAPEVAVPEPAAVVETVVPEPTAEVLPAAIPEADVPLAPPAE